MSPSDDTPAAPLSGVTVVDLSRYLPGPFAAHLLASLGARVLKVEEPTLGDPVRFAPPFVGGRSALAAPLLAGVESVALDLKKLAAARPDVTINQIILAAPDVDRDVFENLARQIQGVGRGITLYASSSDLAMRASRRFGGGVPRAGDVPEDGPVVVAGIDTIDITAVSTAWLALNHSGYAESKALINDIGLLLRTGERPPEKRIPILERIERRGAWYWRYPQPK